MTGSLINETDKTVIPVEAIVTNQLAGWRDQQEPTIKNWVSSTGFEARPGQIRMIADSEGRLSKVLFGVSSLEDYLQFGALPCCLNDGVYTLANDFSDEELEQIAMAWLLGSYRFDKYLERPQKNNQLLVPKGVNINRISEFSKSINLVRDMINTPTDHMRPVDIADMAINIAKEFGGKCHQIIGEDLLKENFPVIHAVGRGSVHEPRLIDLRWGDEHNPKITLVGKGVCFDSGGLDIKSASGMRYMKKDMAGAAHVLGLARMIMATNLNVCLRVLIPAVENAVSGNSYHPGDIIRSRKGATIEVTNTDAEGRLVLSDALTEASSENPDLIVDIATLTGAARIAVGNDISAMFTQNDELAEALYQSGEHVSDPIWRLPMYEPYRKALKSPIADLVNAYLGDPSGSAIIAALFLSEFVPADINWVHFDIMAWNNKSKPEGPEGGEAMAIRALYHYLKARYG